MNEFKTYHPLVNFIYFLSVIGFSMFFMQPICLSISALCGLICSAVIGGKKKLKKNLLYMIPMVLTTMLLNPLFNHQGMTVVAYFPSGNPLTAESVIYGLFAGIMLISVLCWFSCFNEVMTSDKFIYLFGKIIPSLSLIFSMTLRFVPCFFAKLKEIQKAQKCIGKDMSDGKIVQRIRHGISILSVMITWALESSVETADSMRARGYGLNSRTAFSNFKFSKRDFITIICTLFFDIYILLGSINGELYFEFFPSLRGAALSGFGVSVYAVYFMLCTIPVMIESWEGYKWKLLKSKI